VTTELGAAVLPYSRVVGQDQLKLALELSYISPGIGGVLISGQRGTAKSTSVRAFCLMMYEQLPVTLPINATDDRVIGGWRLDELMRGDPVRQPGLLEEAGEHGVLYIDEVNLLDDHLVNIILDVSSTGVLTVQREALDETKYVDFSLVGTMNPDEGSLRPQLLDRFGLLVQVESEADNDMRREILQAVLRMDEARFSGASEWLNAGRAADRKRRQWLQDARSHLYRVDVEPVLTMCADIAANFQAAGHRGDAVMVLAARALGALEGVSVVTSAHVRTIARLALQHRRPNAGFDWRSDWTADDDGRLDSLIAAHSAGQENSRL
jgi:magnesium chelatase subunit I